ncbi:MAG: plasmid pRiA4b ORF-3 family protein [Sporichthyaceae bacterium]
MPTLRLRATLREVAPTVLRILDVPADTTLPELHELLQAAMGWTDSHLHEFEAEGRRWSTPDLDMDEHCLDETGVRVRDLPVKFAYRYDFGDCWDHDLEVLGPGEDEPGLRYGEGACPPEDCGGSHGYEQLCEALADPRHPDHVQMREWVGDRLPAFDEAYRAQRVREAVGCVPESVRLLLALVGEGLKLTPGGRLPRVTLRQMQEYRPHWSHYRRPAHIEEDLVPLAELHDVLRAVGLLRPVKGVLKTTRAAAGDAEIVRRLRSHFPSERPMTYLSSLAIARLVAEGPATCEELAIALHPELDQTWTYAGRPMQVLDLRLALSGESRTWQALDLMVSLPGRRWSAGPSARTLLPGVPIIADAWNG